MAGVWNCMIFKFPSKLSHSMILQIKQIFFKNQQQIQPTNHHQRNSMHKQKQTNKKKKKFSLIINMFCFSLHLFLHHSLLWQLSYHPAQPQLHLPTLLYMPCKCLSCQHLGYINSKAKTENMTIVSRLDHISLYVFL